MTAQAVSTAPDPDPALSAIPFTHLARLTDDTGLFEHARHTIARREHGYCTDDAARGLVVTGREADPSAEVLRLAECYLTFLTHAQDATGAFHNRLGFDRVWADEPAVEDWWGRALWGLGTAAARCPAPWIREEAHHAFAQGASRRSGNPRSMAFAALGAAELLRAGSGGEPALSLLSDAVTVIGHPGPDPHWPWPEERLTYANAALAETLIAAGDLLDDPPVLAAGLRMLTWLLDIQTHDGHLSALPAAGWRRGTTRPRYDQQPIEVAALADACATAATITGARTWRAGVDRCIAWFLGDNDIGQIMWNPATGGGYDGLTPLGPNLNQGAESTLALIATLQHGVSR
ncbi:glycosyltransferase [Actinoplanes sp. NBRC 101535]|uniref:glycosyltransferase n=1 Tax=Actinoplanes sp. NBRC 101535 TaxID=3032196 RepID=UPI0024A598F5|nr:glycosyltransferase [Actinoplanes sp. NBRC 101535]GLY05050.1 glycosyl transferase [Actinoplanes sp. NBRC 101535]